MSHAYWRAHCDTFACGSVTGAGCEQSPQSREVGLPQMHCGSMEQGPQVTNSRRRISGHRALKGEQRDGREQLGTAHTAAHAQSTRCCKAQQPHLLLPLLQRKD